MKRIIALGMALWLVVPALLAQDRIAARTEYIDQYKNIAIREMNLYGIPASITLAQGILESGDGTSTLAREGNNHFGIKCHSDWGGERMYHDDDSKGECFRVYRHAEESYRDHSLFLKERSRYAELFKLDRYDYRGWAEGLKEAGYATDPRYPERLIKLVEENQLYLYDQLQYDPETGVRPIAGHPVMRHPSGLKYVVVAAGDNWNSLSLAVDVSIDRLLKYNDLQWDARLVEGDVIFLERKYRRGYAAAHRAQSGETMHNISQRYGIRLDRLYKRNLMLPGEQPRPGELIVLRGYRK